MINKERYYNVVTGSEYSQTLLSYIKGQKITQFLKES